MAYRLFEVDSMFKPQNQNTNFFFENIIHSTQPV